MQIRIRRWPPERYNEALTRFGFPEIHFVYEPVAAAFYFAQNLKADATVLVADFGGGTTDYSIIRFETIRVASSARRRSAILALALPAIISITA